MKTLVILVAVAVLLVLIALAWRGKFLSGTPGGPSGESELRIEIRESAGQAEQHYRQIRQQFAGDRAAAAWVAECVRGAPASQQGAGQADTWLRACWAAYAREHEPQQSGR